MTFCSVKKLVNNYGIKGDITLESMQALDMLFLTPLWNMTWSGLYRSCVCVTIIYVPSAGTVSIAGYIPTAYYI